jgi:hypothetical protein
MPRGEFQVLLDGGLGGLLELHGFLRIGAFPVHGVVGINDTVGRAT